MEGERSVLALSHWPRPDFTDEAAAAEVNWIIDLVSAVRSVRSEMNIPNAARMPLVVVGASEATRARLSANATAIGLLARATGVETADAVPPSSAQLVLGEATLALPLAGIIDFDAEQARLEKEIGRIVGEITRIDKKLDNAKFVAQAPEEVVEAEREKRATYVADSERLSAALKRVREAA